MKSASLILLLVLSLACHVFASGPPDIFIASADTGMSFRLVDHNRRSKAAAKTLEEVEAWIRDRVEEGAGEFVFINPDSRTSFRTVFDLMRRLKAAGVKHLVVSANESNEDAVVRHSFRVKAETIESRQVRPAPPTK